MQARIFPSFLSSLRTKYEKLGAFSFPIGILDNMTDEENEPAFTASVNGDKDLFEKLMDELDSILASIKK